MLICFYRYIIINQAEKIEKSEKKKEDNYPINKNVQSITDESTNLESEFQKCFDFLSEESEKDDNNLKTEANVENGKIVTETLPKFEFLSFENRTENDDDFLQDLNKK